MSQMTSQERAVFEARVKEHNYALLTQLEASLTPLSVRLDEVQALASGLIITDGTELLRIRDVLVANVSSLKSMMEYHVNATLPSVVAAHAPPAAPAVSAETAPAPAPTAEPTV